MSDVMTALSIQQRPVSRRLAIMGALGIGFGGSLIREASAQIQDMAISAIAARLMSEHAIPGLVIGIVTPDLVATYPFGLASSETGAPVTAETVFELGSISKVYTATLAALGYVQGRLRWSDPVSLHVPEFADFPIGAATLLDLGTYSAGGLPLQFPDAVTDLDRAFGYYKNWLPVETSGAVRQYSNPSVGLFGYAAAAAMGSSFEDLLNREFFPGLKLHQTHIQVPDRKFADYAWGHDREGRSVRVNPGVFDSEAYGIKATASDVLRFISFHLNSRDLTPDWRAAMHETRIPRLRTGPMIQSLGWEQYDAPFTLSRVLEGNAAAMILSPRPAISIKGEVHTDLTFFNKTGSTGGFGAYIAFVRELGTGLVILANRNFPIPARVEAAWQILSIFNDLTLKPDLRTK